MKFDKIKVKVLKQYRCNKWSKMSDIKEKYKIGEYSFDTFHEYRDAQEDLKKIEVINDELDIHDPEVAVRLYNRIRDGEIVFKSPIGEKFFDHVADIVADKSVGLLEDKAVVDEAEHKVRYQKFIGMAVVALAAGLFVYFGFSELENYLTAKRLAKLSGETKQGAQHDPGGRASSSQAMEGTDPFSEGENLDPSKLTVLPELESALSSNPDLVGWIRIADTRIDYPVVQRDNSYYLDHAFDGSQDSNGTLFMDERCDNVNPTTNTIIYGHNMNSGLMFGGLKHYLDEDYLNSHRTIEFTSLYQKRTYEIVAVCLAEVEYADDDNFRYYNFISAENQNDWDAFVTSVQRVSVYGDNIDLAPGDKVMTLSTCNNYTEDGRLFLVAKQIS